MKYFYHLSQRKVLGDLNTPVSIYLKVRDIYPQSALLESSDFYGSDNSRSYIALCPVANISVNCGLCRMQFPDGSVETHSMTDGMAPLFEQFLSRFEVSGNDEGALCGLLGYTAFDAVRYLEDIPVMEWHDSENDAPDVMYILYKYMLEFDHFRNELSLAELLADGESCHLNEIETLIDNRNFASYNFDTVGPETPFISDEDYKEAVREGVRHCLRGDVFQIVLSRRFEQAFIGDDFKVYRALRSINPSPYLFYFDFGGFRIFGSSPETHCRIVNRRASIDPIAGTAFRTGDPAVDKERVERLIADPKENAEHVMLVDLARNDLSRNAHNVALDFYKEVQYYSHVIHLTSRVSGTMNPESTTIGTYLDTFPAGTLSGAPKIRAMQLISEIEQHNRGAYGGCIGFIGFDGSLNQAITIRSFVSRGNVLYYQAGAGVVAQSNDERELQEVNSKLAALKDAIVIATLIEN